MINVFLNSIIIIGNILLFLVLIQFLNCLFAGYVLVNKFNGSLSDMSEWLDDQVDNPTTLWRWIWMTSPVLIFIFLKGYIDGRFFTKLDDDDDDDN